MKELPYLKQLDDGISDNVSNSLNEKAYWSIENWSWQDTSPVVNIWRFNATLSETYDWSIPATSIIINRPVYETRMLTYTPTITFDWTSPSSLSTWIYKYLIRWNSVVLSIHGEYTTAWTWNAIATITNPFTEKAIYTTQGLQGWLNVSDTNWLWPSNNSSCQFRGWFTRMYWNSINANALVLAWIYEI